MIAIQILLTATLIIMAYVTFKNIRHDHAEGRSLSYLIPKLRRRKILHKQSVPINLIYSIAFFGFVILLDNLLYYTESHCNTRVVDVVLKLWSNTIALCALLMMVRAPGKLELLPSEVLLTHFLWMERIKFDDILSIKVDSPDKDVKRISGSIGISGNWGKREDMSHGIYYAGYGKRNKCLFVRLKNGDGYMLGAKDPEKFVEEAKKAMKAHLKS